MSKETQILTKKYKLILNEKERIYCNSILSAKGYVHNVLLSTFTVLNTTENISNYEEFMVNKKYANYKELFDDLYRIHNHLFYEKYQKLDPKYKNTEAVRLVIHKVIDYIEDSIKDTFRSMYSHSKQHIQKFLSNEITLEHFLLSWRQYFSKMLISIISGSVSRELPKGHQYKMVAELNNNVFMKYIANYNTFQTHIRQSFIHDFCKTMIRHYTVQVGGKYVGYPKYVGGKHKINTAKFIMDKPGDKLYENVGKIKIPQSHTNRIFDRGHSFKFIYWYEDMGKVKSIKEIMIHKDHKNDFYIIVPYEVEPIELPHSDLKVAIDPGIASMLSLYNGQKHYSINPPKRINKLMDKLGRLQVILSKKMKGSKRYNQIIDKIQKVYRKMKNIRKDFNHYVTKRLLQKYGTIHYEKSDITGWKTKHNSERNNKLQNTHTLGQFGDYLRYKSKKFNRTLLEVSGYEKATRTCSNCKHDNGHLDVLTRIFNCSKCGLILSRDHNAAINIYNS